MSFESGIDVPKPTDISCDTCVAACCRAGATLTLHKDEASKHRRAMNTKPLLRPKDYPQRYPVNMDSLDERGNHVKQQVSIPIPQKYGFYILLTDCGYLDESDRCTSYDDRPEACVAYEVGSPECLAARATFGLDGHEATAKLGVTEPIQVHIPRYDKA